MSALAVVLLVVGGIVTVAVALSAAHNYYVGKAFETWYKIAWLATFEKLRAELQDRDLAVAVSDYLFLEELGGEKTRAIFGSALDTVKGEARTRLESDPEFRQIIMSTLCVKYARDHRIDAQKVFDSPAFEICGRSAPSLSLDSYVGLVKGFHEKWSPARQADSAK